MNNKLYTLPEAPDTQSYTAAGILPPTAQKGDVNASDFYSLPSFLPESPPEPMINITAVPEGSTIRKGVFKSPQYVPLRKGWKIDNDGNAEFNDGIFNGTFNIGGTSLTIGPTEDIQANLDKIEAYGGGTLYLQNGIYVLTSDVSIPAGVELRGVSRDGVIIDCNLLYKVKIIGSNGYTTGTITINDGDTTVVGSGTAFTAAMVGRSILLGGSWYSITAFTDTTHITIDPYAGDNLAGQTYAIADVNVAATLAKVNITNATGTAFLQEYVQEAFIDDIIVSNSGTGMEMNYVIYPRLLVGCDFNGVNLDMYECWGWQINYSIFSNSTVGAGVIMQRCGSATFFDSSSEANTGNGISMTDCSNIAFVSCAIDNNGGNGIELISGNTDIQFLATNPINNGGDGIKLTATNERIAISTSSFVDNGGYGINIAASSNTNNTLIVPTFYNNALGDYNDQGTNTNIVASIPSTTALAAEDMTIGTPVGISNLLDGYISPAATLEYSKTITANAELDKVQTISISTDKILMVYDETSTTNLKAVVGTINRASPGNGFTFGSIQTITTTQTTGPKQFDICKLDTDKFAIVYNESGATANTRLVIATVSGTTITLGTPVNLDTSANAVTGLAMCQDGTNKAFVAISKNVNQRAYCFTASGTVATIGSAAAIDLSVNDNQNSMALVATDKFVISDPNSGYAQCGTASGTTITMGTAVQYDAAATGLITCHDIMSPASNVVVIRYATASTRVICATIATRTLTFGAAVVLNAAQSNGALYPVSSSSFYSYGSAATDKAITLVTISGNTLTNAGAITQAIFPSSGASLRNFINMGTYFLLSQLNGTTHIYFIQGMSNNFIGIIQATVTQGNGVSILTSGTDSHQSNLQPGASYLVQNGTFSFVSSTSTVNSLDDVNIVKALSATQVII